MGLIHAALGSVSVFHDARQILVPVRIGFIEGGVIPRREDARNIHPVGTRHAVAASGAGHLLLRFDDLFQFLIESEILFGQRTGQRLFRRADVFLDHFLGIHPRQDDGHFGLIVKPAEGPSRG